MNEPVDKMLTSRIRQVFEEFEDPTADAGWKELRKKYPERNRRPLFLWLSSAAALLIIAAGLWLADQSSEQLVAIKPEKEKKASGALEKPPVADLKEVKEVVIAKKKFSGQPPARGVTSVSSIKASEDQPSKKGISTEAAYPALAIDVPAVSRKVRQEKEPGPESPADIQLSRVASVAQKSREDFALIPIDSEEKPVYIKEFNPEPVEAGISDKTPDTERKKLVLSLFAGSHFNYSEGSQNQLNFGAGFTSDIRLTKNLKLSTGASIASNSLDYDSARDLPARAYESFNYASTVPSSGSLTTITSYNANLLTLDIPLNIKYQFVPESDRFYVSAGFSSGTYLNETYAYEYRSFSTATGNYVSQTQDQKIKKQLNDFDLGRTLNLSLGISTGFGKTQVISIEPFMKYPLGGLGSENLRFGSAGINLKLRFTPQKK